MAKNRVSFVGVVWRQTSLGNEADRRRPLFPQSDLRTGVLLPQWFGAATSASAVTRRPTPPSRMVTIRWRIFDAKMSAMPIDWSEVQPSPVHFFTKSVGILLCRFADKTIAPASLHIGPELGASLVANEVLAFSSPRCASIETEHTHARIAECAVMEWPLLAQSGRCPRITCD
jgi:hypothetical protein